MPKSVLDDPKQAAGIILALEAVLEDLDLPFWMYSQARISQKLNRWLLANDYNILERRTLNQWVNSFISGEGICYDLETEHGRLAYEFCDMLYDKMADGIETNVMKLDRAKSHIELQKRQWILERLSPEWRIAPTVAGVEVNVDNSNSNNHTTQVLKLEYDPALLPEAPTTEAQMIERSGGELTQ